MPRKKHIPIQVPADRVSASMRPGHCAPEKAGCRTRCGASTSCFNEAGALCPGKSPPDAELIEVIHGLQ